MDSNSTNPIYISRDSDTNGEVLWLVKSGDRVQGPYSTKEIEKKLRAKELVVIDEVIAPRSRWRHIRDEAAFAQIVDEIRRGIMAGRDDTEAGTRTPIIVREEIDDATPVATEKYEVARFTRPSQIKQDQIQDAQIVSETNENAGGFKSASARELGSRGSSLHSALSYTPPKQESGRFKSGGLLSRTTRLLWIITVILIGASVGGVYFFKFLPNKKSIERAAELEQMGMAADLAWKTGQYATALRYYEQINRDPHLDYETDLRQAILVLRTEKQAVNAKRMIIDILPKLTRPDQKARAQLALALSHLQQDEPVDAQNILNQLVKESGATPLVIYTLGCAQAAAGLRGEAIETLKRVDTHPDLEVPAKILRAILLLKDGLNKQAASIMEVAHPNAVSLYRQEYFAMGAVTDFLDGNKKRSSLRQRLALDSDPIQNDFFAQDLLFYSEAFRWKVWLPFVDDLAIQSKTNLAKALYAMALVKSDRRQEAQSYISDALGPRIGDSDLQAVNSYLFYAQGRDDEARGAIRLALGEKQNRAEKMASLPVLASLVEARICERSSDKNCSDQIWLGLLKRDPPPLMALINQARIELEAGHSQGQTLLERLKIMFPTALPVMELNRQYQEAGSRK